MADEKKVMKSDISAHMGSWNKLALFQKFFSLSLIFVFWSYKLLFFEDIFVIDPLTNKGKSFKCATKTRANLTTYIRKPGNYNSTISFEIDIMKNSSPINLNLCQTWHTDESFKDKTLCLWM